jgi:hypothetical protein
MTAPGRTKPFAELDAKTLQILAAS